MCHTHKKGPFDRENRHTEPRHRRTQDGGPPGSVQDEGRCERRHPGVGRTPGSAEPLLAPTGSSFGGKIATAIPTSVPSVPIFVSRGNRPIQTIKGGGETLSITTTQHKKGYYSSWRRSCREVPTCIFRVGSVRGGGSEKSRTCQPLFVLYLDRYESLE